MSEIRCPYCKAIIHKRDIKRNKCWNCSEEVNDEIISKEQEKEKRRQEQEKQARLEKKKELENRTLTEKYDFLTLFQYLVGLSMIIYTYFFITTIIDILENSKRFNVKIKDIEIDWYAMVIPYFLFLFYSICIISIVNFLFNLDNNKSDKK